jgi:hypothetical protein
VDPGVDGSSPSLGTINSLCPIWLSIRPCGAFSLSRHGSTPEARSASKCPLSGCLGLKFILRLLRPAGAVPLARAVRSVAFQADIRRHEFMPAIVARGLSSRPVSRHFPHGVAVRAYHFREVPDVVEAGQTIPAQLPRESRR